MALAEKNLPKLRALNAKLGAPSVQSLQDNLNALHSHVVKHQRLFSLKDKLRTVSALGYRKVFKRLKARLT